MVHRIPEDSPKKDIALLLKHPDKIPNISRTRNTELCFGVSSDLGQNLGSVGWC